MRDLEDNLAQQRQQIQDMETDLAKKSEQLRYAEDENYKQKINLTTKIKERDDEIQRLRNQVGHHLEIIIVIISNKGDESMIWNDWKIGQFQVFQVQKMESFHIT